MLSTKLKLFGRIFYGVAVAGVGMLHLLSGTFRPLVSPIKATEPYGFIIYIFGAYFVISGMLIAFGKNLRITSIILAYVFILFIVFSHFPWLFFASQYGLELGTFTNTLKLSAFAGGALLIAFGSRSENMPGNFMAGLARLVPFGKYFFCIMLLIFGIDHFVYRDFVSGLVPKWIPLPVFWTYFTGIALIGSALSILINFKVKLVAQLLAIMLFIWLLTIHLVLAIRFPNWNGGENITACFQCLAFTGIALTISSQADVRRIATDHA
jgi:uncharacterized membrane protein